MVAYHTTSGLLNLNKNRRTGLLLQKDNEMRKQNIYYDDLIVGNILKKVVVITAVAKMVFRTTWNR
jgi:hypothetical protein